MANEVKPIVLRSTENPNEVYVLEFNRESVRFSEARGFRIGDLDTFSMTSVEDLFWYAFRKNHMKVTREKAMDILYNQMKGLPDGMVERLAELYAVPVNTLAQDDDEKNSMMTVEM